MTIVRLGARIRESGSFLKKERFERNKVWAAAYQLLSALNLPPSPSALFCPAPAPPCAGLFLSYVRYVFNLGTRRFLLRLRNAAAETIVLILEPLLEPLPSGFAWPGR
jgi:hypothetical protein